MKTTLEIPDPLFQEAKEYAMERGVPFREIVALALRSELATRKRAKPFRLKKCPFKGHGLAKDLNWEKMRDLIYEGRGS